MTWLSGARLDLSGHLIGHLLPSASAASSSPSLAAVAANTDLAMPRIRARTRGLADAALAAS
ncbi:NAD(P)-binding protein [Mycobacterium avium subsp. paratuberculosis]|nr:NAD(P)-binding protein [Mycobacterium avium subsp. paratuberculosis]